MTNPPISPQTCIGHVHLKVSDLERAVRFYTVVLGFELTTRFGSQAAFLSAGGYHHHIGLNTWESQGGTPPPAGHTGLYHAAILLPTRRDLAFMIRRLADNQWPLVGAADHGVSEAIYLEDPDKNGLEIYIDRPRSLWPQDDQGGLQMYSRPLDLDNILAELA